MALLEFIGLGVLSVSALLQVSALATIKWKTFTFYRINYSYGIFRACVESNSATVCSTDALYSTSKGAWDAVKAMSIIAFLLVAGMVIMYFICKHALKKNPMVLLAASGATAALLQIAAVAIFASKLKPASFGTEVKFGASFYVACISVVTIGAGTALTGIGLKRTG